MSYTEELTAEIVAEYVDNPTRETVDLIANRLDKSIRSVIAKLSSAGVYITPERKTKNGDPVEKKENMTTEICTLLGIEAPTLTKSGKEDLRKLRDAIRDFIEGIQDE